MRRLLLIEVAALCGALLVGSGAASAREGATRSGWKTAIYPQSYFGPNSSYRPGLNIDFRSHQSFDTDLTNVSRRRIGEIHVSLKVPCTSGPPAIPIQATNRPTPAHAVPVKIRADGSFSLTLQAQYGPFQGVSHMTGGACADAAAPERSASTSTSRFPTRRPEGRPRSSVTPAR
jgi:hypothetical protein